MAQVPTESSPALWASRQSPEPAAGSTALTARAKVPQRALCISPWLCLSCCFAGRRELVASSIIRPSQRCALRHTKALPSPPSTLGASKGCMDAVAAMKVARSPTQPPDHQGWPANGCHGASYYEEQRPNFYLQTQKKGEKGKRIHTPYEVHTHAYRPSYLLDLVRLALSLARAVLCYQERRTRKRRTRNASCLTCMT